MFWIIGLGKCFSHLVRQDLHSLVFANICSNCEECSCISGTVLSNRVRSWPYKHNCAGFKQRAVLNEHIKYVQYEKVREVWGTVYSVICSYQPKYYRTSFLHTCNLGLQNIKIAFHLPCHFCFFRKKSSYVTIALSEYTHTNWSM